MPYHFLKNAALVVIYFSLFAGCKSLLEVSSVQRTREIIIDGNVSDWKDPLTYLKDYNLSIGFQHDNDNLYFCMTTNDRQLLRQIMFFGMTVWFDPVAGTNKVFGIRYPMPRQTEEMNRIPNTDEELNRARPGMNFDQLPQEAVIYEPGSKEGMLVSIIELTDIRIRTGFSKNIFVYECMIPLRKNSPHLYSIGIESQEKISIGIETGMRETNRLRTDGPPRGEGMNPGGHGGMRPGRRSGAERPDAGESFKQLSFWTLVQLHP
jgi:hypothetical protein